MKKQSALLSTLLIVVAIIVVVNYLVGGLGFFNARFDLTQKKLYTLNDGTRRILTNIQQDKPVTLRFYATRDSRLMPQWIQSYATSVEDLLLEFEKASNGKIALEKIDPRPDSESEDKARADDIQGHVVNEAEDKVYFGLAIQCADQKEIIPALSPNEESSLEYQIARAIAKVTKTRKSVLGVLTPLPIAEPAMSQQMMMMMQKQQQQPWAVITQLRMDYEVRKVQPNADKIDADINILLVIHPADLAERTEFAIDQFVLRGGKVIAFVDPQCAVSSMYNNQGNPMMGQPPSMTSPSSTLKNLFKAWGVGFEKDKVVADMTLRTRFQKGPLPTFLTLNRDYINRDEQITAPLEVVQMFSPGAFTLEKKEGLASVNLLESSENSEMLESAAAEKARNEPLNNFQPEGKKRILGLRLNGHFKTAFPGGQPKEAPAPAGPGGPGMPRFPGDTGGAEQDAGAPASTDKKDTAPDAQPAPAAPAAPAVQPAPVPSTTLPAPASPAAKPGDKPEAPKPSYLTESVNNEGIVFLFSDADMLFDGFCFQQDQLGRLGLVNHNVPLLLNIIEMLNGGADLINVRSRGSTKRPFTKLQEMSDAVEKSYRPQIEELTRKQNEIAQKISTIRVKQDTKTQMIILDPKQKKDLEELMETQSSFNKQIRDIKKEQNKGKDRLEMLITVMNLVIVPLFIITFGVVLAIRRRSVQAAH